MASTNDTILPGDREVQKMSEYLQNKMIYAKKKTVKCLLFAGKCSSIHIIHVAPLGARSEALNHNHLDVFSWCPGIPHYTKDFVKLNSNRFVLEHKANQAVGPKEGEQYVFVYYDQGRDDILPPTRVENKLLSTTVGSRSVPWYNDVIVIKISKVDGQPIDMSNLDIASVSECLMSLLKLGGLA